MSKTEENRTRMLEGPVGKTLAALTVPMIFGILSMVLYNLVDAFFVGQLGKDQLAALSFTFPVVMTIGGVAQGLGMGTSAAVSRAIGSGNYEKVRRLATDSLTLGLLVIVIGVIFGLLTVKPLFHLLGARGNVLDYIAMYMRIWYIGMIFVVVPMIGNNIIRATGDTKIPGLIMVLGALMNFALDPLLIFGLGPIPSLGIRGAALATLVGRGSTFFISMYVLVGREHLLTAAIPRLREVWASWRVILHVGLPNAGARVIVPLGQSVMTRIVASYGAAAVAGYGVGTRVEFFSLAAINALSSVIGPFIGQNLGARQMERVKRGFTVSLYFSLAIGLGLFVVYLFLGDTIASLFNDDPTVISVGALYIRIVSVTFAAQGFYLVANAGLNVLHRPLHAAGLSVMELFGIGIPLALLGTLFFGVAGVFAAIALSYAATGAAAWFVMRRVLARYEQL